MHIPYYYYYYYYYFFYISILSGICLSSTLVLYFQA